MEKSEMANEALDFLLNLEQIESSVTDNVNVDNMLVTPPARENTETDLNSPRNEDLGYLGSENYKINDNIPLDGRSTDRSESIDVDINEREHMIAALEKIAEVSDSRNASADVLQINDDDPEPEIIDITERLYDEIDTEGETTDTYTDTPKGDLGLTTGTFPELAITWNSSAQSSEMISSRSKTPYTNQYLDSKASFYESQKDHGYIVEETKPVRGVKWGSRIDMWSPPKKPSLFGEEDNDDNTLEPELQLSRNASRLALESREAMFRRAMTLLSTRCTSVKQDGDLDKPLPFGYQMPKYFYVTQEKPLPMEPLKAWRGYHGNVYFEPININPLNNSELLNEMRAKTSVPRKTEGDTNSIPRAMSEKENRPTAPIQAIQGPESRSESRQTNKSSTSQRTSTRQMAILDKQAVLNRFNDSIHEDIVWLEGQENTGSLAVRPKTYPNNRTKEEERDLLYNKERIRKGSVVHKLYVENKTKQKPKLAVSGGKFTPPNSLSPLLRTQTQYSLSSHRLTTNSPDPYHHNDSKLPPLDQIRASLKHMDNKGDLSLPRGKSYNRSLTLTDDMKPFVKYSPDVVAKFAQKTNSC